MRQTFAPVRDADVPARHRAAAGHWALACARELKVDLRTIHWVTADVDGSVPRNVLYADFDSVVGGWVTPAEPRAITLVVKRTDATLIAHEIAHLRQLRTGQWRPDERQADEADAEATARSLVRRAFGDRGLRDWRRWSVHGGLPGIRGLDGLADALGL